MDLSTLPSAVWTSPVLSGLITATATLLGVLITSLSQKWRSAADLREKRVLARDQALREWRHAQLRQILDAMNRRPGLLGYIANQASFGDAKGARKALTEMWSKDETIADSRYRAVDDADFDDAMKAFQQADLLASRTMLEWIDSGAWKRVQEDRGESIQAALRPAEDAIVRVNRAAEAYIHRIDHQAK